MITIRVISRDETLCAARRGPLVSPFQKFRTRTEAVKQDKNNAVRFVEPVNTVFIRVPSRIEFTLRPKNWKDEKSFPRFCCVVSPFLSSLRIGEYALRRVITALDSLRADSLFVKPLLQQSETNQPLEDPPSAFWFAIRCIRATHARR